MKPSEQKRNIRSLQGTELEDQWNAAKRSTTVLEEYTYWCWYFLSIFLYLPQQSKPIHHRSS